MKKKLAVIMCAVMLISIVIVSITAAGAENTVALGDLRLTGEGLQEWTNDSEANKNNPDYSYDNSSRVLTIKSGKAMTISAQGGSEGGATQYDRIEVDAPGVDVNLKFKNLKINMGQNNSAAFKINAAKKVIITLEEENSLLSGFKHAGLQNDSIPLEIKGTGLLEAEGGGETEGTGAGAGIGGGVNRNGEHITISGSVTINAKSYNGGAGIGGGSNGSGNDINIIGSAQVTAIGGFSGDTATSTKAGAGIGGGYNGGADSITIKDSANVTATGYVGSAGIGGGKGGTGMNIYIYSGTVNATGTGGAGIGGGDGGKGESIYIYDGTVKAYGSYWNSTSDIYWFGGGAGIGGGRGGDGKSIYIYGGKVEAESMLGAGIGGGGGINSYYNNNIVKVEDCKGGSGESIYIYGGDVTAICKSQNNDSGIGYIKNSGSAGIGGGSGGYATDIIIKTDGEVKATGGLDGGAGIGGGNGSYAENIKIGGNGTVKAYGNDGSNVSGGGGGAGIGGGKGGYAQNITIGKIDENSEESCKVTIDAKGGYGGAGIGGGSGGYAESIEINGGGKITATSHSSGGAGIGGGSGGSGTGIAISGDVEIDAESDDGGAGIGGGYGKDGSNITIDSSSKITAQSTGKYNGGAGIGGGNGGNGSYITIESGTIIAKSTGGGAGIGGGQATADYSSGYPLTYIGGNGENITINGGKIEANGSSGAGIGGGNGGNGTGINIGKEENNTVDITATSSSGAGIGGGNGGNGTGINIGKDGDGKGSTVDIITATSSKGAGIGGGCNGSGIGITIDSGTISATSTDGGAGIGGGGFQGMSSSGKDITINGGNIDAKGIGGGAGIGGQNVEGIKISGGNVIATSEGNGAPPAAGIGGSFNYNNPSSVTGIEISGGNVTANGSTSGGVGIGGSSTQTDITITGGTVRANVGGNAPGISGADVKIEGTSSTSYPWVVTNKIDSDTDHSGSYHGIVFDKNYNDNYGKLADDTEATDEEKKISEVRQEHKPDGVVYGDVSLAGLKEPYMLESGETLTVHKDGKLTTGNDEVGNKLTLKDGATLYLENGAALNNYQHINGYQDEGNGSKILHECKAAPAEPGDVETTCTICGSPVPHKWRTDWDNNATHHWHNCDADDCSVLAEAAECSITENSKKNGYGEHKFGAPAYYYNELTFKCVDCGFTYSVKNDIISVKKVGIDSENDESKVPLAGAEFKLYGESTNEAGEKTQFTVGNAASTLNADESEAVAVFNITGGINLGQTYYIEETKAPDGYKKSYTVYTVVLNAVESVEPGEQNEIAVQVVYSEITSDNDGNAVYTPLDGIPTCVNTTVDIEPIQIYKEDDERQPLAGVTFGLYSNALCNAYDKVGEGTTVIVNDPTSPAYGKAVATLTALPGKEIEPGTYYIKEIAPPEGYIVSETAFMVVVDAEGKVTYGGDTNNRTPYTCKNKKIAPGVIQISNVDGRNNTYLSGAVFTLYADNDGSLIETSITAVGNNGFAVFNPPAAADSLALFAAADGQEIGVNMNYVIMQTAPPPGYEPSEEQFRVEVSAEGTVTYDGTNVVPTCKNYKRDEIIIYKTDINGNSLEGASFDLYIIDEDGNKTVIAKGTSAADGKVSFVTVGDDLIELDKTYYIKETAAPEGYKLDENRITVVVGKTGIVTYNGSPAPFECVNEKIDTEPVDPNPVVITPDPIQLYKTDGEGNPLAGASFGLYSDPSCTVRIDYRTTAINAGKAVVSFSGVQINTTYYIKEIAAPEGYNISEEIYTAAVESDGKVKYGSSYTIPVCINEKVPAEPAPENPPAPVDPTPVTPVNPYPPFIVIPTVTEPAETEPEPVEDEPFYEDVSSGAGMLDDDIGIDGKGLAAVITLIALASVGSVAVRKKTSKK